MLKKIQYPVFIGKDESEAGSITCTRKEDCASGEFCSLSDYYVQSAHPGCPTRKRPEKHCYKIDIVGVQFTLDGDLRLCNSALDCGSDQLCYSNGRGFLAPDGKPVKGVCVTSQVCPDTSFYRNGVQMKQGGSCSGSRDCLSVLGTNTEYVYAKCVASTVHSDNRLPNKLCCVEYREHVCPGGYLVYKDCRENWQCRGAGRKWCDKSINQCCIDDLCPDNSLIGPEPKCKKNGTVKYCPKENGICHNGYCCPPTKVEHFPETDETVYHQARYSYVTGKNCTNETGIDEMNPFGYCHPVMKKIVVMGMRTKDGKQQISDGDRCTNSKECRDTHVCVKMHGTGFCFLNEENQYDEMTKKKITHRFIDSFAFAIIFSVVFMASFSGMLYICYKIIRKMNRKRLE